MKYDFTSIMDRRGKDAIAVDSLANRAGLLPGPQKRGLTPSPCGWRI